MTESVRTLTGTTRLQVDRGNLTLGDVVKLIDEMQLTGIPANADIVYVELGRDYGSAIVTSVTVNWRYPV